MTAVVRSGGVTLLLVALLAVSACASKPVVVPELQTAALQWNQRGHAAFDQGDYQAALADYAEALSANRAIENVDGIAEELMNLAVVHERLGDNTQAQRRLDEILAANGPPFSSAQRAEAAYRKAVLALDTGAAADAAALLDRALEFCRGGNCVVEGRVYNLRARIALANGDAVLAHAHAKRALEANRRANDVAEQANSLRLMADATFQSGDAATAHTLYGQALDADKTLGDGAKIALDLIGIGRCYAAQGQRGMARQFYERARNVWDGLGDAAGVARAETLVKSVSP
jgi:tetratricopeptide (TPR) repeat protein